MTQESCGVRKVSAVVFQQVSGLFNMHMPIKNWLNWFCFFSGQSSTTEQSYHNHSDNQVASCRIRCADMVSATEEENLSEYEDYINSKPEIWLAIAGLELDYELRRTILSDRGWLDDNVINAAQSLLKDQYGMAGLQKTTLGTTYSMMTCSENSFK